MRTSIRALGTAIAIAALLATFAPGIAGAHTPHTVQPGESLWSIAAVNGLGVEELAAANGLPADAMLATGSVVQVPEATGVADGIEGSGACVWDCASTVHPHPTDETVSGEVVAEGAAQEGMSSSLVEAIAIEESGLSNAAVSSANARGVMQIIPDTWEFINQNLAESPLDPASAAANVEAGALYLHHLYHLKGGDRDATIGSYFQGPNRDDVLPETRAYIDRVNARQAALLGGG